MTAHVSGLPIEEVLPTLITGGAFLIMRLSARRTRLRPGRSGIDQR